MINFFESYLFQSLFCPYVVFFYRESSAVVFTFVISDVAGNKAGRSYGVVMGAVFKVVFELCNSKSFQSSFGKLVFAVLFKILFAGSAVFVSLMTGFEARCGFEIEVL